MPINGLVAFQRIAELTVIGAELQSIEELGKLLLPFT
jgi:hypothetical protein